MSGFKDRTTMHQGDVNITLPDTQDAPEHPAKFFVASKSQIVTEEEALRMARELFDAITEHRDRTDT